MGIYDFLRQKSRNLGIQYYLTAAFELLVFGRIDSLYDSLDYFEIKSNDEDIIDDDGNIIEKG